MSLFPLFLTPLYPSSSLPQPTPGLLGTWRVRCMRWRRRDRLQWIALASPSEVAWDRIISFLLMSSTSGEGGESITPLLFFSLSPLSFATAAASQNGTYVYCIIDERQPAHQHTQPLFISLVFMHASLSHTLPETISLLGPVYQERQLPCCKSSLGNEVLFRFTLNLWRQSK